MAAVFDMTQVPTMLSIKEAAGRTGLSYDALRRLCLQHRIAHIRVGSRGGKYLINFESLINYLNTGGLQDETQHN